MPISVSAGWPIPEPFSANDVTIWTDLICKFMCHNMNTPFDVRNFLRDIIEDKVIPSNVYDNEMLKNAARGDKNAYYNIFMYCIELLKESITNITTITNCSDGTTEGYLPYS